MNLVPCQKLPPESVDLTADQFSAKIAIFNAVRFFDLDETKVEFSGYTFSPGRNSHKIRVQVFDGTSSWRFVSFDAHVNAQIQVRPLPGVNIRDAIRCDLLSMIEAAYLRQRGFPEDYPVETECNVSREGELRIEVTPCT